MPHRAILAIFLTPQYPEESSGSLVQIHVPAIFDSHLEFLRKTQNYIHFRNSVR